MEREVMASVKTLLFGFTLGVMSMTGGAVAGEIETTFHKSQAGSRKVIDHSAWTAILKVYVKSGADGLNRVDYARLKAEKAAALKTYVATLSAIDPTSLDKPEQIAFWANLYNAKTVEIIIDNYPVKSIKDISLGGGLLAAFSGGPWKAKVLKVSGVGLSLDDIEHVILRPYFKDPRLHYAVNCASVGCPNLLTEAFSGASLEAQLDRGARSYVNSPRGFLVRNGTVKASSIYKWFVEDFGGDEKGVIAHALRYAEPKLAAELKGLAAISSYDYDWSLNAIAN
jgi:hypothetical protein